ncbi:MAGUK p55 subfamily member 7-like isoform X1 [Synchiropus splendidus]|uniref:MAGUK p55 subfamily member 7-like isoform X1 n=4 Tax=Synchiropus splendidus TaxID=270530 RepID=UPI00237E2331|nr:MAGUK p55 subfamily member 7-like isoform X1 [Synchiropus splendidus]
MSSVMPGSCTDREEDYRFLHSMLMEKKLHLLFKIHEQLRQFEKRSPVPVQQHAMDLASDLFEDLMRLSWTNEVKELAALFSKPHFKSLFFVHDAVAQRDFEPTLPSVPDGPLEEDEDSVKIVSLVKTKEPLGATIKKDESTGAIVVARVMRGSAAEKSGLIHEGDELKEVNGISLEDRKPKEILPLLARSQGEVKFTIVPALKQEDTSSRKKLFVRALFDYNPDDDPTVPCKDAAVAFRWGDILQIVDKDDDAWWQACQVGEGSARAGLIPSQQLHERRVALQRPKALFNPRRLKSKDERDVSEDEDYRAISGIHIAGLRRSFRLGRRSSLVKEAARSRRWSSGVHVSLPPPTYIEVIPYTKDTGEQHRLVVLVGPSGVGVNELKRRLLLFDPDRYAVAVPYTTREPKKQEKEGTDYHFVSLHKFEEDILNYRFIEYGRYSGHYYGISLDSVKRVKTAGKVCLLDIHPSKIKHVYSSEFKPYVVFVKPPRIEELRLTRRRSKFICDDEGKSPVRDFSEDDFEDMIYLAKTMEAQYGRLFDKVIVNGDIAAAFRELKADLRRIEEATVQWIPTEWMCCSPTQARKRCGHVSGWI